MHHSGATPLFSPGECLSFSLIFFWPCRSFLTSGMVSQNSEGAHLAVDALLREEGEREEEQEASPPPGQVEEEQREAEVEEVQREAEEDVRPTSPRRCPGREGRPRTSTSSFFCWTASG